VKSDCIFGFPGPKIGFYRETGPESAIFRAFRDYFLLNSLEKQRNRAIWKKLQNSLKTPENAILPKIDLFFGPGSPNPGSEKYLTLTRYGVPGTTYLESLTKNHFFAKNFLKFSNKRTAYRGCHEFITKKVEFLTKKVKFITKKLNLLQKSLIYCKKNITEKTELIELLERSSIQMKILMDSNL